MIALVTGASSGIGKDMAKVLAKKKYAVILVARSEDKLKDLKKEIEQEFEAKAYVMTADLSQEDVCYELYNEVKEKFGNIQVLVNNAGFGLCGNFTQTDLDTEINMIKTNVVGLHILTKLFLKDMVEVNEGHILNVASIAGFMPGPLMATYYATKNYVVKLSESIREELRKDKSKVQISILCPGPVNTNFNKVANVEFDLKGLSSEYVAKYAMNKLLKGKFYIVPGLQIKLVRIFHRFIPASWNAKINYNVQRRKIH